MTKRHALARLTGPQQAASPVGHGHAYPVAIALLYCLVP